MAVITGAKTHDVIGFARLFRRLEGVDCYVQHLDDFAAAPEEVRDGYDVLLFYFMPPGEPVDEGLPGYRGKPRAALSRLGQTGQGIVILHHALLAYPTWPFWGKLVGIADRTLHGYSHDETLAIQVNASAHTITQGLARWTIIDETYDIADADPDNEVLLTVDHPANATTLAWTRSHGNSRVFCLQLGHDAQAWADSNFQTILDRGIAWSAGR